MTAAVPSPAPIPRLIRGRSVVLRALVVALLAGVMGLASQPAVDVGAVPITLQTLALFVLAGLAGMRMSFEIVVVWLAMAAMGLPVLADGEGGPEAFVGPTAGYLVGMLVAAPIAGRVAERTQRPAMLMASFLLLHVIVLVAGWAWLAGQMGAGAAFFAGVTPFIPGAIVKSVLAGLVVWLAWRLWKPA